MIAAREALIGTWRLESWELVYADRRPSEHPLGETAVGFLMYSADGYVSATLMRSAVAGGAGPAPADGGARTLQSLAYAGRFEVAAGVVTHIIEVASDATLVGLRNRREIALSGARLVLLGADFTPGTARTQRIAWTRA